jgi:hypothetical protein
MHAFDVLGDPVRRRILELLVDDELTSARSPGSCATSSGSRNRRSRSTCACSAIPASSVCAPTAPAATTRSTPRRYAACRRHYALDAA